MIYILMIWTTVAASTASGRTITLERDWRPLGEFHHSINSAGLPMGKNALEMCEDAGRQLGLKVENFRCVRAK